MKIKELPIEQMKLAVELLQEAGIPLKDIPEMDLPDQE
jgi:hypothetical protein